jgi:hypothetical protein
MTQLRPSNRAIEDAIQAFLMQPREPVYPGSTRLRNLPWITLPDGLRMSVQVSCRHYCKPRSNTGPWTHVEIGYPTGPIPEAREFREGDEDPDERSIFPEVPLAVLALIIWNRGGTFTWEKR